MRPDVWVGTKQGLYRFGEEKELPLPGRAVSSLTRAQGHWWAILEEHEIARSPDGQTWERLAQLEDLRANCLLPLDGRVFIGTSEAHLYLLEKSQLRRLETFEAVPGRESWFTPWGGPPDVRSISSDPEGRLYVNVHVGGVLRADADRQAWTPTIDPHADVHEVAFDASSERLLAACARGLAVSEDHGASWRFDNQGLHGAYCRAVTVANDVLLLSASTGAHTNHAAIYHRSVSEEGSFERARRGLPERFPDNINTSCLHAKGDAVAFGTEKGQVFLSLDQGASWSQVEEGLPPVRCLTIA
jgi:hypothetical protein